MSSSHTYAVLKSMSENDMATDDELLDICSYLTDNDPACPHIVAALRRDDVFL